MKKLSIVIVNYNVEYFLDQCLQSVFSSLKNIDAEVFVVDNNSVDHSVEMLKKKYPHVNLIVNNENVGFSKANNQAITLSNSEYILLLNPDTLVQDDTFEKVVDFMDSHPDAGGLGVQMIDGKGNFLAESKRGLPTPWVAFYKIFGFSRLFPNSKRFGRYHLSYLDKNENHEVDVLSGAFFLLRKEVIDKIGALDEAFFMYGEDIDLSYRINKAGFKNYYFADTKIIHYKGESTKKGSLNYVITFYNAMLIFARKHYSDSKLDFFIFFIKLAIFLRASLAILNRFAKRTLLPLIDFIVITLGFYLITKYWETNVIFPYGGSYPSLLILTALPIYVLIWQFSAFVNSSYDKKVSFDSLFKGIITGTVIILLIYSVLDTSFRFSRALIFMGSIWALISMIINRLATKRLKFKSSSNEAKKLLIVGSLNEAERVKSIIFQSFQKKPEFIEFLSVDEKKSTDSVFIGNLSQIEDVIRIYGINEVVFCGKDLSSAEIIEKMSNLQKLNIEMKIAPADSIFIIGSNSINAYGDVFTMKMNNIDKSSNRVNKRIFDFSTSIMFLIFSPLLIWFFNKPQYFILNTLKVLVGKKTWVSYSKENYKLRLPKIKSGILSPLCIINDELNINEETKEKLNLIYARDYKLESDIKILWNAFSKLDSK